MQRYIFNEGLRTSIEEARRSLTKIELAIIDDDNQASCRAEQNAIKRLPFITGRLQTLVRQIEG